MIVPNKFTPLDKSVLAKISYLVEVDEKEILLTELYSKKSRRFKDVSEFIIALDVLYTLGKIDVDPIKRIVRYVD